MLIAIIKYLKLKQTKEPAITRVNMPPDNNDALVFSDTEEKTLKWKTRKKSPSSVNNDGPNTHIKWNTKEDRPTTSPAAATTTTTMGKWTDIFHTIIPVKVSYHQRFFVVCFVLPCSSFSAPHRSALSGKGYQETEIMNMKTNKANSCTNFKWEI